MNRMTDDSLGNNILIVDDTPANLHLLASMLEENDYIIRPAVNGHQALEAARLSQPDLILLDIMMPDIDGYKVCSILKADPVLRDIPVIFISALHESLDKVRAFSLGASDYITKPFQLEEVLARVRTQLEVSYLRKRDKLHIDYLEKQLAEQEQAEQQRLALALERERVKLLSTFVQDAAHEFKTSLTIINSSVYLLTRALDEDQKQKHANKIHDGTTSITRLVDAMLDVVKLDSGIETPMRDVNLNEMVQNAVEMLQALLTQKAHKLNLDLDPNIPPVLGYATSIRLALRHILENAFRFTDARGTINVSTRFKNDSIITTISDNGIGIREENLPHIFEHFYRVDEARTDRGFGLGLSIVSKVVEIHHGQIEISSQFGRGTTVTMILPVNQ